MKKIILSLLILGSSLFADKYVCVLYKSINADGTITKYNTKNKKNWIIVDFTNEYITLGKEKYQFNSKINDILFYEYKKRLIGVKNEGTNNKRIIITDDNSKTKLLLYCISIKSLKKNK